MTPKSDALLRALAPKTEAEECVTNEKQGAAAAAAAAAFGPNAHCYGQDGRQNTKNMQLTLSSPQNNPS